MIFSKNGLYLLIILLFALLLCIYEYLNNSIVEGFLPKPTPVTYSDTTTTNYNNYIKDKNGGIPLTSLQQIGVPENNVDSFIKNGVWNWTPQFTEALKKTIINSTNQDTSQIDNFKKIYPEELWPYMFASMTGGQLQQIAVAHNLKCNVDSNNNLIGDGMYELDSNGQLTNNVVAPNLLPTRIPGFTFLTDPSCNPCNVMVGNYDCPFAIPATNTTQPLLPSFIMDYVWGIDYTSSSGIMDTGSNSSTGSSNTISSIYNMF